MIVKPTCWMPNVAHQFMQFKGADETIVVRRLAKMDMDSDIKLKLCWSLAAYLVTVNPGRYEYFFDVATSNTQAMEAWNHVYPDLLHTHLLCPDHYEHYARSGLA